jgi:hypothetical protein
MSLTETTYWVDLLDAQVRMIQGRFRTRMLRIVADPANLPDEAVSVRLAHHRSACASLNRPNAVNSTAPKTPDTGRSSRAPQSMTAS